MCPKELALLLSKSSPHSKHKMGAVINLKRKSISVGINHLKTHPVQRQWSVREHQIWLHAEMAAMISAKWDVKNTHMYIARTTRQGTPGSSRPCSGCYDAMKKAGVAKITFFENEIWKTEKINGN